MPADVTVRELLHASGLDSSRVGVIGPAGDPLPLDTAVGDQAPDGSLLWVFDTAAAVSASRAADEAQRRRRARTDVPAAVRIALVAAIATALTVSALLQPHSSWIALAVGLLALGAAALVFHPAAASSEVLAMLAPAVAFAAGAVALSGSRSPQAILSVGAIGAATVACLRHGYARLRAQPVATITGGGAFIWAAIAVVLTTCFLAGMPAHAPASLLLAASPLAFRALTPASVPIEEEDLLDMPFLVRDAPGVRGGLPRPPRRVDRREVSTTIVEAGRKRDSAAVLLAITTAASAWGLLAAVPAGTVSEWCAIGGTAGVAAFLALWSRTAHQGVTKVASGLAAIAAAAAVVVTVAPMWSFLPAALSLGLFVCGAIATLLIRAVQKGWRSLGWSRAGDLLEGALVALTPAVLLYASGIIDEIGRRIA